MELGTAGFEQERPTDVPAFHDTVKDGWRGNTTKNFKWEDKEELMALLHVEKAPSERCVCTTSGSSSKTESKAEKSSSSKQYLFHL